MSLDPRSSKPLPSGKISVSFDFVRDNVQRDSMGSSGTATLSVNGEKLVESHIYNRWGYVGSFGVGQAYGSPVTRAFSPPFKFTGTLERVVIELE